MPHAINTIEKRASTRDLTGTLQFYMKKGASANKLTWIILGGKSFMNREPNSMLDFVVAGNKGVSKLAVINLAEVLNIPMKDMATLLNISYKTLARKNKTDVLNSIASSLCIEIAHTVAKGLSLFEDPDKLNKWLHEDNRALKGQKPFNLLNTPTGLKLVNQILGRIEEGVYT